MRRRLESPGVGNIWPAFTDVLGGLLVVLVFLITIFVVSEVLLSREMSSQDSAIGQLAKITEHLEGLLGEATARSDRLQARVTELSGALVSKNSLLDEVSAQLAAAEAAREGLEDELSASQRRAAELGGTLEQREAALGALRGEKGALEQRLAEREGAYTALESEKAQRERELSLLEQQAALLSARAERVAAEMERLNRALTGTRDELAAARAQVSARDSALTEAGAQIASLRDTVRETRGALAAREQTIASQESRIEELDRLIKRRLVDRVEELEAYASDFFGRLRKVFADNPDIKVVGDRFVFQSEVLFASGEAKLSESGKGDLDQFVGVYRQLASKLPDDLPVIIEVQGHTDRVPIRNEQFQSNWELSTARALGVLHYLEEQGIPPRRLAAKGMGEYHPIDPGSSPEALRRNRRIELKISSR